VKVLEVPPDAGAEQAVAAALATVSVRAPVVTGVTPADPVAVKVSPG